jgi:hypothetical protein
LPLASTLLLDGGVACCDGLEERSDELQHVHERALLRLLLRRGLILRLLKKRLTFVWNFPLVSPERVLANALSVLSSDAKKRGRKDISAPPRPPPRWRPLVRAWILPRRPIGKRISFFQFSQCLPRAYLGKMMYTALLCYQVKNGAKKVAFWAIYI